MILNYRKIEGTPQLMEKYGLEASIDLSQFNEIIMNRFPLSTNDWSLSTHKDWSKNWKEISSNIKGFPVLADIQ